MPMTETETLYAQEAFDTIAEAEAYAKGFQAAIDYALEYSADYTFRIETNHKLTYTEVVVFKVWEE